METVIAAVWNAIYNLANGVFAYALGELTKAGNESIEAQSNASALQGKTVAVPTE
jgi:hypothetical protein